LGDACRHAADRIIDHVVSGSPTSGLQAPPELCNALLERLTVEDKSNPQLLKATRRALGAALRRWFSS
jgi:hypothetical protein